VFVVLLVLVGLSGLFLHRVKFAIGQEHGLASVLVVMGESVESLSEVESDHHHGHRANHVLLEGELSQLGGLEGTLSGEQVVLVLVELLLHFASKHF
jgi:hypothetical protein